MTGRRRVLVICGLLVAAILAVSITFAVLGTTTPGDSPEPVSSASNPPASPSPASQTKPPVTVGGANQVVLGITGRTSAPPAKSDVAAASVIAGYRLNRAGIRVSSVVPGAAGTVIVTFADSTTREELDAAGRALTAPTAGGFRTLVLALAADYEGSAGGTDGPGYTGADIDEMLAADCETIAATGAITLADGNEITCDVEQEQKLLLGPVSVPGESIASYSVSAAEVPIALDAPGTKAFATLTAQQAALEVMSGEIVLTVGSDVLVRVRVETEVTTGNIVVAGEDLDRGVLPQQLAVLAHGISLAVDSITVTG